MISTIEHPGTHAAAVSIAMQVKEDQAHAAAMQVKEEQALVRAAGKVPDYSLVRALRALKTKSNPDTGRQWSNTTLASALGLPSDAYVSLYCNQVDATGQPHAKAPALTMDLGKMEDRIRQFLETMEDRAAVRRTDKAIFSTAITDQVATFCRAVRAAAQWGLFHGPSGCGKTSGLRAFAHKNPACLHISALEWCRGASGLERGIYQALNKSGSASRQTSRMAYIADRLKGGGHMLTIDNAQKLTARALHFLADLRDEFALPVVMAGTRGVLETLRADSQLATRIDQSEAADWAFGFVGTEHGTRERHAARQLRDAADSLLTRLCPDHAPALRAEARRIISSEEGTMRALAKRIQLMLALMDQTGSTDAPAAFAAAHARLISSGE